jgi:muramoyltetrapeptide carboxypeptidase
MTTTQRIKPRRLQPGSTIGIVAPAGPPALGWIERGTAAMEERGYKVVVAPHALDRHPQFAYLAGLDADRAADMNEMFGRSDIDAVFCACGGYGCARVVDLLDWDLIRANPKLFLGFSDITTLHLALEAHTGMVTVHAKMLSSIGTMEEPYRSQYWSTLENDEPAGTLDTADAAIETLVPGVADGQTAGGCICLLSHACGTKWNPDLRGKIVLLEDVGDGVYRIDRFLIHLRHAAGLDEAAGFVVGTVTDWRKCEADPPKSDLADLWRDILAPLGKPAVVGYPIGHLTQALSVPLGVQARLDATSRTLTLLESGVTP